MNGSCQSRSTHAMLSRHTETVISFFWLLLATCNSHSVNANFGLHVSTMKFGTLILLLPAVLAASDGLSEISPIVRR